MVVLVETVLQRAWVVLVIVESVEKRLRLVLLKQQCVEERSAIAHLVIIVQTKSEMEIRSIT